MRNEINKEHLEAISQVIFDKKGCNILVLDVRNLSTITDYFIIAEGTADRHVSALSHAVVAAMKETGLDPCHVEGEKEGDWVVIDYLDCIIHLFTPMMREKYRVEDLWQSASIVDIAISVSPKEVYS